MLDGGILCWVRAPGARRRAGQRGPSVKATFTWIVGRLKLRLAWWPDGRVRVIAKYLWLPDARHFASDPSWQWEKRVKRVTPASSADAPRHVASLAPGGLDKIPGLIEHCAVTKYEDNAPRKVGAVRWWSEGAEWCVRVSDPDSACSFVTRAETLWDALLTAELLITSDRCPWAPDTFLADRAAKKKK